MRYLLGIDVGTTGTKTLLFRQDGKLLGHAYCDYETKSPDVGSGVFESAEAGHRCMAIPERIIYPNPKHAGMYREQIRAYRKYAELLGEMEVNG